MMVPSAAGAPGVPVVVAPPCVDPSMEKQVRWRRARRKSTPCAGGGSAKSTDAIKGGNAMGRAEAWRIGPLLVMATLLGAAVPGGATAQTSTPMTGPINL